jgi:hypothetical protein
MTKQLARMVGTQGLRSSIRFAQLASRNHGPLDVFMNLADVSGHALDLGLGNHRHLAEKRLKKTPQAIQPVRRHQQLSIGIGQCLSGQKRRFRSEAFELPVQCCGDTKRRSDKQGNPYPIFPGT